MCENQAGKALPADTSAELTCPDPTRRVQINPSRKGMAIREKSSLEIRAQAVRSARMAAEVSQHKTRNEYADIHAPTAPESRHGSPCSKRLNCTPGLVPKG